LDRPPSKAPSNLGIFTPRILDYSFPCEVHIGPRQGAITMKTKTKVKSGALNTNHNLKIKSKVKAGALNNNHNRRVRAA
jgi:hypothetical protein